MYFTDQENENLDYEGEEEEQDDDDEDDITGDYNDVIGSSSESIRFSQPPPLLVRPTPGFNPRLKSNLEYLKQSIISKSGVRFPKVKT